VRRRHSPEGRRPQHLTRSKWSCPFLYCVCSSTIRLNYTMAVWVKGRFYTVCLNVCDERWKRVLFTPAHTPHFIQDLVLVRISACITYFSLFQNVHAGAFSKSSSRGVKLTPHHCLVPRWTVSEATSPPAICLHAVDRDNFTSALTFTFT
jgi:hypothetical protein